MTGTRAGRRSAPTMLFVVTEDWAFMSHRLPMARAAAQLGFQVVVACRVSNDADRIRELGYQLIPLRHMKRGAIRPGQDLKAVLELRRLLHTVRPDVLHLVSLKPIMLGMSAQTRRCPTICTFTGLGSMFSPANVSSSRMARSLARVIRMLCARVRPIAVVQNTDDLAAVARLFGLRGERVHLVPGSGVDPTVYRPRESTDAGAQEGVAFVYVGRFLRDKGIVEFAEAAAQCRKSHASSRFLAVGSIDKGSPTSLSREELASLVRSSPVDFLGRRSDVAQILRSADVIVLPTTYGEGIPKSLLEGAASGLAMLSMDVPGCRDLVRDGENGLLVPPGNLSALVAAMDFLASRPTEVRQMGKAGRELVLERYRDDAIIRQMKSVYRQAAVTCELP